MAYLLICLSLVFFASPFVQVNGYIGDCPADYENGYYSPGFNCPPSHYGSDADKEYCCDAYTNYQRCCTFNEYYGYDYYGWSTGVIIGVVVGGLVLTFGIICIFVACCVSCTKACCQPAPTAPATATVVTAAPATTVAMPYQQPGNMQPMGPPMNLQTVNPPAPPAYSSLQSDGATAQAPYPPVYSPPSDMAKTNHGYHQ